MERQPREGAKTEIEVSRLESKDPLAFDVRIRDPRGETRHRVTAARADAERLGAGAAAETVVAAAFRFLLDREPKEAILRRFDLSVIAHYFPEFERTLPDYMTRG